MNSVFPISPNRAIISANNGVEGAPETVRFLSKEVLKKPSLSSDNQHIVIKVKKVYQRDQTTPNMIQRISGIFERNLLISKEM